MNRILLATLVAVAIAGCQSAPKSTENTAATPASGTDAVTAAKPKEIMELTDQRKVWECPKCGMDYDAAGTCGMDGATLVEMNVNYICPADNKPVEHSGKCPRCPTNARIDKVAVAASTPGGQ
jgi:rubrerythrin